MAKDTKKKKSFLSFTSVLNKGKKTSKWLVSNVEHHVSIGEIKWFGRWRKYCFFPYEATAFDASCLKEIGEFLEEQMKNHKESKNGGKQKLTDTKSGV